MFYRKLKKLKGQKRLEFIEICGIVEREYNSIKNFKQIFYLIKLTTFAIIAVLFIIKLWIIPEIFIFLVMLFVFFQMKKDINKTMEEKKRHIENIYDLYNI